MTPYASNDDRTTKMTQSKTKTTAVAILTFRGPPSSPPPNDFCRLTTRMTTATIDSMQNTVTEKPRDPIGTKNCFPWNDQ